MLTLEHVSKSYGGLPVLNDLSLTLSEGEILPSSGPRAAAKAPCSTSSPDLFVQMRAASVAPMSR